MFWKKVKQEFIKREDNHSYPLRLADIYISDKYNQILFVPFSKESTGIYAELDNLIVDNWPCKFEVLQINIEKALNSFSPTPIKGTKKWPSFESSKAKSQKSFGADYVRLRLETDNSRNYGDKEVERIKVTAQPNSIDDSYSLTGCEHLIETRVAQIVLDIYEACMKIRS